ncbi:NBAS subunit of NRZ tethering complex-like [Microplitis mediator]|uniref:NBAS subunit of NRZ tethering complex-like n=1 Tax=Microplitis mediator TaxID=375433 RepID=UPI00255659A9|nr:NBAS subunit of NRZ tethering complex-like [Microplitis mediator]
MEVKTEDIDNDLILYELLEYFVKKQDPELVRFKNDIDILSTTGTIKNALRYLNNRYSLPESISQQISLTLPWKFASGDNGRLIAILHDNILEIRRSKDEFSSVIGKATVPKDAFPQWRKLKWSPDGSILVLASSNGQLSCYNSLGSNIFNINSKSETQNPEVLEAGDAISSMVFTKPRISAEKWSYEFQTVTYSGLLKAYNISVHGYEATYHFSFGNFYRKGVNAFTYDHQHNIYILAGNSIIHNCLSPASNVGLTSWRPINDYPYYKLSFTFEENCSSHTLSLWNLIPKFRAPEEPVIFRISVSPSCNYVACLHTDGVVSLWNLPGFQLKHQWKLNEQPNYDARMPGSVSKYKKLPAGYTEFHPMDIGWWSDHAIIIARYSGAISVCSISDLKNLLGTCPEFLFGQPQIAEFLLGKGFLCLDCETIITTKKRLQDSGSDSQGQEASDSEKEEDELEPLTLMSYLTNLLRSALYSITDIESLQPKRKKARFLQRTYRILGLKSTTPEELYSRKIDLEEYDEALALAKSYNLDTDLVYQTQWRKSKFSMKAIKEHLSKVRKRSWVLNECIMRVPETLEAARELLNFGLKGTNLDAFLALAEEDDGKFSTAENDEDPAQLNDVAVNLKYMQKVNKKLEGVDLSACTQPQKELLNYRRSLLNHLDKLKTYEIIIGTPDKYKKDSYEKFRQLTILENAVRFARDCDHATVRLLFTYHGQKLMAHWLPIISYFPETLNPNEYKKLLPECDDQGQLFLLYQKELRPKDWSEKHEFDPIVVNNNDNESLVIYEDDPALSVYKTTELTMDLLQKWYKARAYDIERNSCVVENALELIKIARAHNITGLEDFLLQLETLDDLIYKVQLDSMSLAQFEKLSDLEKIKLLMSTATDKNFISQLKNYVLPFIYRKQKYMGGDLDKKLLKNYLIDISTDDLSMTLIFFNNLKSDVDILNIVEDIIELAVDCIYACGNINMYKLAKEIFETLPKPQAIQDAPGAASLMHDLESEIECLKILNKYDVQCTVSFIHDNKNTVSEVKMLLHQMSGSLNQVLSPASQEAWAEVLNDMLELQEFIFSCIDIEDCFEICVDAKLASGIKTNIQNCKSLIETKKSEHSLLKVSYDKTVDLVLKASREYFNSSKSLHDSNMELARACIHLIEDENPLIQEEYDLINSLQILNEFNINILPLQVRLCHDRLKLIESCLNNKRDAYKRQQRLLTLATYLNIEGKNKRNREGKILELIAEKAYQAKDYEIATSTCQKLIDSSYFHAWKIIQTLGCADDFSDFDFKQKCLAFTLTYGPNEILEETLRQMHLLEIQVLNKNLEDWKSVNVYSENYEGENDLNIDAGEDDDDDDDFTDAMTTPQIEVKEFVPKILETSTGLVKSSAQLVKQSTLGILQNVGAQGFWKTALNFNRTKDEDNYLAESNTDNEDKRDEIQSFPAFYASLYDKCTLSRWDTRYERYSMPDIDNSKLKMCQTLLRITTLSETASYGLEVSDINHLFVQLASHVMSDDWQLGMAYLLSFNDSNDDFISHAQEVFRSLPPTNLYIQTAIYFYSLKLYCRINPDANDCFTYDPMELMKMMANEARDEADDLKIALVYWCQQLTRESSQVDQVPDEVEKIQVHSEQSNVDVKQPRDNEEVDNCVVNVSDKESMNLYENEAFKMTPADDDGWDDNWSDFSDSDFKEKAGGSKESDNLEFNSSVEQAVDSEILSLDTFDETQTDTADDTTEEQRYAEFEDLYSRMQTKEDYVELKEILYSWPVFAAPEFITSDKHPTLRMIESVSSFVSSKNNLNYEAAILEEYKELLKDRPIDPEVYEAFIKKFDEKSTVEDKIYLRLCANDPRLHQEAIDILKDQSEVELPLPILDEIFFKNLTSLLPPTHPIHNKILEEMFSNHTIPEIEPHIRILIDRLTEQKHVTYAVALWNRLKAVPSPTSF